MAENLGELIVSISADMTKLQKGLADANVAVQASSNNMSTMIAKIGPIAAVAAAAVVTAFGAMIKSTAEYGEEIFRTSERTGISTEVLSRLKYVADQSQTSFQELANGLKFLAKNMSLAEDGNGKLQYAFQRLGVTIVDSNGQLKKADDVFLQLADRFAAITDDSLKTALAMQIFGRAGTALIPVLNLGSQGIKDLEKAADNLGLTLTKENAVAIEHFDQQMKNLKASFGGLAITISEVLIPPLTTFIEKLTAGIVKLREFIDDVKTGNLFKMMAQEAGLGPQQPFQGKETAYGKQQDAANGYTPVPGAASDVQDLGALQISSTEAAKKQLDEFTAQFKQQAADRIAAVQGETNHAVQLANSIIALGNNVQQSFSKALSDLILHGGKAIDIVKALGASLVQSIVDFIAEQVVAATIGKAIQALEMAAVKVLASSIAQFWAPAAAFASTATFGGAAAAGATALGTTVAFARGLAATGFAEGTDTVPSMLSPNEMVIPSSFASALRSGKLTLGGPAAGGQRSGVGGNGENTTINMNVEAIINYPVDIDSVAKEIAYKTSRELRYLRPVR